HLNSVTYNIPAHLLESYQGRQLIVRSDNPYELVIYLSRANSENVLYAQLTSPEAELEPLLTWPSALPVDVLVRNPAVEYPLLYNFSKLLDKHPIRISISVKNGFLKAVRLALALGFSVKLEVGQPDASLIAEMAEVLDLYLHRSAVSQPVEYFHSTLLSFFNHTQPANLWFVQEEDPEQFRFITNEGVETVSPRFGGIDWKELKKILAAQQTGSTLSKKTECDGCEFLKPCGGYFKWPDKDFDCEGVKSLFSDLRLAAEELRTDLASFRELQGGVPA
ncbi:MAG TPA: hypothetical protein VIT88_11400, partial [Pyrinomonadaceae bacterium]